MLPYPQIDFRSLEWGRVREWLQQEHLETLKRIAGRETDERTADFHRGKAAFITTLLDFGFDNAG